VLLVTGGTLVVRHSGVNDVQFAWDGPQSQDTFFAAAFFADCEHELKEITAGLRLCLIYNLVRTTVGLPPNMLDATLSSSSGKKVHDAVTAWQADTGVDVPGKLIVKLDHE
jgi:hypothetical protein